MQSLSGAYVDAHSVERDPLAGGRTGIGQLSTNGKVAETKDTVDVMQSVGQYQSAGQYLETARKTVEDTPDRTSSEDEQRDHPVAAGLPPMVPAKMAAKASSVTEGIAAAQEAANTKQGKSKDQGPKRTVLEEARRQQVVMKSPAVASKKSASGKMNAKLGKTKMPKKVDAKAERVDRRRKRKAGKEKKATGISQASAKMLFECSCQLLRTQALDYDVRAREMEERNARQAKEIETWEKRIRSLQRELEEYSDEESDARPAETTRMALIAAEPTTARESNEQDPSALTLTASASAAAVEPSLPPAIAAAEAKLHEELHKRTQKLHEFYKSVPGFIDALDEHPSLPF